MTDKKVLIRKIRIADSHVGNSVEQDNLPVRDILIVDGVITEIAPNITRDFNNIKVINADEKLVAMPGLFDMHVHLRDPGFTHKEDIITGAKSALAGGITGVACMPNTNPTIDNIETVKYIMDKAQSTDVQVYPIGCITKGLSGLELCDFYELKSAGVIGVSDDGKPVKNARVMLEALEQSKKNGMLVISHCEDMDIIEHGIMHKGEVSKKLGVKGMDRASEDSITAREIALANSVNARIHIAHVSTKGSVDIIRAAKKMGVSVTAETCPHYFMYTHEKLLTQDPNYRMNPPLREESDRLAVIQGILDGTIDCIVTDHAPHSIEEKSNFLTAPNGVIGMETSLSAVLTAFYHTGKLTLPQIVDLMSNHPRKILGLKQNNIEVGKIANITIVDIDKKWSVSKNNTVSKAKNIVFNGEIFMGKVMITIVGGNEYVF